MEPLKENIVGKTASYVVIVDTSIAFAVQGNPLGAFNTKADPCKEKINNFLNEAKNNGVKHYEVTTDKHPKEHRNFLANLLQDDGFYKVYKNYLLRLLKEIDIVRNKKLRTQVNANISLLESGNKEDVIGVLDSIAPFGLEVKMPQLLQKLSADKRSVETAFIEIGDVYYEASSDSGVIKLGKNSGHNIVDIVDIKNEQGLREVSAWPSHSFDETRNYETGDNTIHQFFVDNYQVDVNDQIAASVAVNGNGVSTHIDKKDEGVTISACCKGQNPAIENYSPFFNEAMGINQDALAKHLKALYEIVQDGDVTAISIPVVGIAYDFCVKNRVLDTINYVAPALQALKILAKSGYGVDNDFIDDVVTNIAEIVEERIKEGNEKSPVLAEDILARSNDSFGFPDFKVDIIIPQGTTVAIGDYDEVKKAQKEMQDAASKQGGVTFSEPEIVNVFENTGALSKVGSVSSLSSATEKQTHL